MKRKNIFMNDMKNIDKEKEQHRRNRWPKEVPPVTPFRCFFWALPTRRNPISTPRRQGQLASRRANLHSKKEWGPLTARRKGKKAGPTTTEEKKKPTPRKKGHLSISRRKGQFEGRAKTHTTKKGPNPTRRMTSQPPNPEKERPNPTRQKRESQRNAPRRKGAIPTKVCRSRCLCHF